MTLLLLLACSLPASTELGGAPRLTLVGEVSMLVNHSSPGSSGNAHGYEDGSVRRVGNTTHMFVSELYSAPIWVGMRLAHWTTTAPGGDIGWR
eukprot:SAG11_NODE_17760_length_509_cov_1.895122_1_plen_92_part_01